MSSNPALLTWLQAAEQVLRDEGPGMHIRDLTSRILDLGIVKSSCATSLETLLYRQTSGGPLAKSGGRGGSAGGGPSNSKFIRVPGKHGWFALRSGVSTPTVAQQLVAEQEDVMNMSLESVDDIMMDGGGPTNGDREHDFESRFFYQHRKRKHSYHSSSDEESFGFMSSDDDAELADIVLGDDESCGDSSEEEDSTADEAVYRKKYLFLKKMAKSMIYENAALAGQLTVIEENIAKAEEERNFLFDKLVKFEKSSSSKHHHPPPGMHSHITSSYLAASSPSTNSPAYIDTTKAMLKSRDQSKLAAEDRVRLSSKVATRMSKAASSGNIRRVTTAKTQHYSGANSTVTKALSMNKTVPAAGLKPSNVRHLLMSDSSDESSSSNDSEGELRIATSSPRQKFKATHKRKSPVYSKKTKTLTTDGDGEQLELAMRSGKVRRLHPIPMNDDGTPVFPIVVGGLRVHNMGKIVYDRPAYHSERYLLPVGFESCRTYPSMIDPSRKCLYTCKILDGGEAPIFEMIGEDDREHPVRAASSTACQTIVLKNINKARDKQATNSGSGPEFFGYSNPTVLNLIQKLPDAKKCTKYKFVRFAEPHRRGKKTVIVKSAVKTKMNVPKKQNRVTKKKFSPKSFYSSASETSVLSGYKLGSRASPSRSDSSLAIAPVLGTGQYGLEAATMSYSSSDELSSGSENDLVIDS